MRDVLSNKCDATSPESPEVFSSRKPFSPGGPHYVTLTSAYLAVSVKQYSGDRRRHAGFAFLDVVVYAITRLASLLLFSCPELSFLLRKHLLRHLGPHHPHGRLHPAGPRTDSTSNSEKRWFPRLQLRTTFRANPCGIVLQIYHDQLGESVA